MKKIFSGFVVLLGVLSMSLVSCSKKEDVKSETKTETTAEADRSITIDSKTIYGEDITNAIYKKNDLTLVNIMATWCGPCVKEIPELQQINKEDNGFGVVGIVIDTFDDKTGNTVDTAVAEAQNIAEKTGAEYPLAIPTELFLEQTLKSAAALLPMSFIVDQNGKVLKGPIAGAREKDEWLKILNTVKASLN